MIVVAGGTGRLGRVVVRHLLAGGQTVRVLTRDASRAADLAQDGADVCVADVRDARTLTSAVSGAQVVVSAVHGFAGSGGVTPQSVDREGNAKLVAAARAAEADVVLMSIIGAAADHPMELFRMKAAAETALRESGARWTIVRASAFIELYEELTAAGGKRPLVFGRGDNPINFVSVADVATVVVEAVTNASLRGRAIDVPGPTNLTMNQLAARVMPGARPRHVPQPVLRLLATAGPGQLRRQAAAALVMDTTPMRVEPPDVTRPPPSATTPPRP